MEGDRRGLFPECEPYPNPLAVIDAKPNEPGRGPTKSNSRQHFLVSVISTESPEDRCESLPGRLTEAVSAKFRNAVFFPFHFTRPGSRQITIRNRTADDAASVRCSEPFLTASELVCRFLWPSFSRVFIPDHVLAQLSGDEQVQIIILV